jgi:hypothetical protein
VTAEHTDDDTAGDPATGGRAPGQRATRRASTDRSAARRAAATIDAPAADQPDTPAPPVTPVAAPTTLLATTVTTTAAKPVVTPAAAEALESPTTEIREAPRAASAPLPTNIYRSRRPGVAILLAIPAIGVGVLLVRALAMAAFGDTYDLVGIVASVCGLTSLPFLVAGIYGLISGAAHGAEHYGSRVWARPPLAYLIIGFTFVLATALTLR